MKNGPCCFGVPVRGFHFELSLLKDLYLYIFLRDLPRFCEAVIAIMTDMDIVMTIMLCCLHILVVILQLHITRIYDLGTLHTDITYGHTDIHSSIGP